MEIRIFNKIVRIPIATVILGALLLMVIGGMLFGKINIFGEKESATYTSECEVEEEIEEEPVREDICVYIVGCVKHQKVITISEGATVADVIEKVGGVTKKADLTAVNLAYRPKDGEMITIPSKSKKTVNDNNMAATEDSSKININSADKNALMSLSGIGEVTANKILEYRESNGPFSSIEDIKSVSGIGEAKFSAIKDNITV